MSEPLLLRRLLPEGGSVTAAEAAADIMGRELLLLNMVTSLDGHTAVGGRSRGIRGGRGDRALFHALRAHADVVLVGTATMRAEQYRRWIRDDGVRAMRVAAGLAPQLTGATVTRRGDVPWDIPLFADPHTRVIVYSGVDLAAPPDVRAEVEVVVIPGVEPATVVADLRARGLRSIVCEGGATLNAALLEAGLVDELELVLAPQLVGGTAALTAVHGRLTSDVSLEPVQAYLCDNALLLRYRVARSL